MSPARTGEMISSDFIGGLVAEIQALRADVEALKRAGFVQEGSESPGTLVSSGQATKLSSFKAFSASHQILVGTGPGIGSTTDIGANEVVGRTGTAAVDGIALSANEVLGRAGSGSVAGVTAATDSVLAKLGSGSLGFTASGASKFFAQLSSGDLGFKTRGDLIADMDILGGEAWEFDDINRSKTLTEGKMGGLLNHSADITVTLPTPAASGCVFFVADTQGIIDGTHDVTFATAGGSDTINGSTGNSATYAVPWVIFLFIGSKDGSVANWILRTIATI